MRVGKCVVRMWATRSEAAGRSSIGLSIHRPKAGYPCACELSPPERSEQRCFDYSMLLPQVIVVGYCVTVPANYSVILPFVAKRKYTPTVPSSNHQSNYE